MSELEGSLISIRQARDTALSRAAQLTLQLSRYEERLAELSEKIKTLEAERQAAIERETSARGDRDQLQVKVLELNGQKLTTREQERVFQSKLRISETLVGELTEERDLLATKLANLSRDHDRFKAQQNRSIADLAEKFASSQRSLDGALATVRNLQSVVEGQTAELANSRDRIAILSAENAALREFARPTPARVNSPAAELTRIPIEYSEPDPDVDIGTPMAAVLATVHLLGTSPESAELLETLEGNLNFLEQRAKQAGSPALHRYVWTIVEAARWLRKYPQKTHECLPVLLESADLLPELAAIPPEIQAAVDPSSAHVYTVDDDMDNCECIAMALEKLQINTAYETCPERALAELRERPCDAVILDVDMPGMDGISFYEKFKEASPGADIPVIFLSGLTTTESRLKGLPPGNFTYVSKPYNLASLGLTVATMLLKSRVRKASAREKS